MKKIVCSWLSTLVLIPALSFAETGTDRLNEFVETVETLSAHFTQTVTDADGQLMEEAEGEFYLSRPGQFRWDYTQPYPQEIVADGEQVWFYDVDLEQITTREQQQALSETPASLLSGEGVPEDQYDIQNVSTRDGLMWVALTPKEAESNYQQLQLGFHDDGLREMLMEDSFGQTTRLVFSDVEKNPDLDAAIFDFEAPAGVDVVGETAE